MSQPGVHGSGFVHDHQVIGLVALRQFLPGRQRRNLELLEGRVAAHLTRIDFRIDGEPQTQLPDVIYERIVNSGLVRVGKRSDPRIEFDALRAGGLQTIHIAQQHLNIVLDRGRRGAGEVGGD